jgi:hypothetical protein
MTVRTSEPHYKNYYTVTYEAPSQKTGTMKQQVNSYVEDPVWFRGYIEKRGGRILSEKGPRQVQTLDVSF